MVHPVDAHVGKRIKERRDMLGVTQQQLAKRVRVTFQQIQKYENGRNRVSTSRLWDIAAALDTGVAFFFAGLNPQQVLQGSMIDKETVEAIALITSMTENQKKTVFSVMRSMVAQPPIAA